MKRAAFALLLLLAACQSPLARDYPAPWTRLSPEGLAALNALAMGGVGSCVERRHATIPNQFLLACSYDHSRWVGLVVASGQRRELARYYHDDIVGLGLPPRELLPARSGSETRSEAEMNDMNGQRAAGER
ncbi:hypothetical protein [Sphingosinicella sp.]|uniref:hypothetical protein n=1 Tax=Sphingosinicella sp. TaxID=1917971 RepID=UPI004037B2B7